MRSAKTSTRGFSIARFALFLPAKRQSQKQQPRLRVSSAQTRLSKCRSPSAAPLSRRQIARREQGCCRARFSGQSLANTPCVVFKLKRKSLASNSFDAAFWLSVQIAAATKTIVPTPLPNTVSFSVSSWRSQRLTSPSGEASGSHTTHAGSAVRDRTQDLGRAIAISIAAPVTIAALRTRDFEISWVGDPNSFDSLVDIAPIALTSEPTLAPFAERRNDPAPNPIRRIGTHTMARTPVLAEPARAGARASRARALPHLAESSRTTRVPKSASPSVGHGRADSRWA